MSQHDSGAPMITGADMRKILINHVLRGAHKPPSHAACDKLARLVGQAGAFASISQSFRDAHAREERLADALETLAALLPEVRRGLDARNDALPTLDRLAAAVTAAQTQLWGAHKVPVKLPERWHDIAGRLAAEFREAMASTNPGLELGLSNTGPVARFIAAMTPIVTGEALTRDAIARHLQRAKRG